MNECLLIIDPQKDFTSSVGFYAEKHEISRITVAKNNINDLLQLIQDTIHIIIVYSDYRINQFGENFSICIPDTEGHEIDIGINDSYLSFAKNEYSAFSSRQLVEFLKRNCIEKIYIAGFLAEYCIRATAIDAIRNDFEVILLRDCIGTGDDHQDQIEILFREIADSGGHVSDSRECFSAF